MHRVSQGGPPILDFEVLFVHRVAQILDLKVLSVHGVAHTLESPLLVPGMLLLDTCSTSTTLRIALILRGHNHIYTQGVSETQTITVG